MMGGVVGLMTPLLTKLAGQDRSGPSTLELMAYESHQARLDRRETEDRAERERKRREDAARSRGGVQKHKKCSKCAAAGRPSGNHWTSECTFKNSAQRRNVVRGPVRKEAKAALIEAGKPQLQLTAEAHEEEEAAAAPVMPADQADALALLRQELERRWAQDPDITELANARHLRTSLLDARREWLAGGSSESEVPSVVWAYLDEYIDLLEKAD